MKRFEVIRPKSLQDSNYAEYEYCIRWIGRDGSDYLYMFYDAEFETQIKNNVINQESSTRIESLIDSEQRNVTLKVDNLSKNDLTVIGQMFSNKYVTRLLKNGSTERYAPESKSYKYRLMDLRYSVEFTLIMSNLVVWK